MKYLLSGIFMVILFAGGYYFLNNYDFRTRTWNGIGSSSGGFTEDQLGGDVDQYGCKQSAGYGWCEEKGRCIRSWEESCTADGQEPEAELVESNSDVAAAIIAEFEAKYGDAAKAMTVTVSEVSGEYAKGSVSEQGGGGMWFAAKTGGKWELVYDGNGVITCEALKDYPGYPAAFIPECYDEAAGSTVKR